MLTILLAEKISSIKQNRIHNAQESETNKEKQKQIHVVNRSKTSFKIQYKSKFRNYKNYFELE